MVGRHRIRRQANRIQAALLTAYDGLHRSADRGSDLNAGIFFVKKEALACFDNISFFHGEFWCDTNKFVWIDGKGGPEGEILHLRRRRTYQG